MRDLYGKLALLLAALALAGCTATSLWLPSPPASTATPPTTQTQPPLPPAATPRAASGRILFVSARDGDEEIYVMNADGSGLLRLTDNPGPDSAPAWAPDRQLVAFVAEVEGVEQLFLMRSDG
ncbi:MAG: hypothetical protein HGA45_38705, partial [Chloroflexales bacterium]|nr:hypothetical protein [Chloroflexales bacterium]